MGLIIICVLSEGRRRSSIGGEKEEEGDSSVVLVSVSGVPCRCVVSELTRSLTAANAFLRVKFDADAVNPVLPTETRVYENRDSEWIRYGTQQCILSRRLMEEPVSSAAFAKQSLSLSDTLVPADGGASLDIAILSRNDYYFPWFW